MKIFLGEFLGTLLLILLGNGAVANVLLTKSKGNKSGWIVITAGWGLGVCFAVYVSLALSGAHVNPAVTLGLALVGKSAWSTMPIYFAGQFLGAMAGAFLVWLVYYPHFRITLESKLKLMVFATKPAIYQVIANLFTEIIATAVLLIGVMTIIDPRNQVALGLVPYLFGLLVLGIGISLGGPTGYAINPARDLGPRLMHFILPIHGKGSSEWGYAWIPVVGPFIGAVIGVFVYQAIT